MIDKTLKSKILESKAGKFSPCDGSILLPLIPNFVRHAKEFVVALSTLCIIGHNWKIGIPLAIIVIVLFGFYEKWRLRSVVVFFVSIERLVDYYLTKVEPIPEKLKEKILAAQVGKALQVTIEVYRDYMKVKRDNIISCSEVIYFEGFKGPIWEFSIEEFLTADEYKSVIQDEEKNRSVMPERLVVWAYGPVFKVFGEKGRFGETFDYMAGEPFQLNKSANILLETTEEFFKKFNFERQKNEIEDAYPRNVIREKGFIEYSVTYEPDGPLFSGWHYSVRTL